MVDYETTSESQEMAVNYADELATKTDAELSERRAQIVALLDVSCDVRNPLRFGQDESDFIDRLVGEVQLIDRLRDERMVASLATLSEAEIVARRDEVAARIAPLAREREMGLADQETVARLDALMVLADQIERALIARQDERYAALGYDPERDGPMHDYGLDPYHGDPPLPWEEYERRRRAMRPGPFDEIPF